MTIDSIMTQSSLDTMPVDWQVLLDEAEQARLRGDYRAGARLARRAADVAEAAGDGIGRAGALRSMANQLLRIGEHESAITACNDAVALLEDAQDEVGLCETLTVQAMPLNELGLHEEALEVLGRARDIAQRRGDRALLYWVHNRTGVVHSMMGDYGQATEVLARALTMVAGMDDEARFCVLNNVVDNAVHRVRQLRASGDPDAALRLLTDALGHGQTALGLARAAAHPYREAISLDNWGMLLALAGDHVRAFALIDEAQAIAVRQGYHSVESSTLLHLAEIHLIRGEHAAAVEGLLSAVERAAGAGEKPMAMAIHEKLSSAYELIGDHAAALRHYRIFHQLEREARDDVTTVRARMMMHHVELDNARLEADNAQLETELHRIRGLELEADKLSLQRRALELDRYAHEDSLTGLGNRRFVDLRLPQLVSDTRRLCVAIADVDLFKGVNDRFGHQLGDDVLRQVATMLRDGLDDSGLVARLGGEEFVIAFENTELVDAHRTCDLLREQIAAFAWASLHPELAVTVSIGVVQAVAGADHRDVLARADHRLYAAKRNGRNRVEAG